jgi:hypothetical protein
LRVIAKVKNVGAPGSPETAVALRYRGDDGAPLATADVPALEPGKSAEVAFDLPAGTQPEGEALYTLKTDELNVVADAETNNNEVSFSLLLWLDSDQDGMPDGWETEHGLNANDPSDASEDADHDGMTNYAEWRAGTDAQDAGSFLSVTECGLSASGASGTVFRLNWGSVSNRLYTVSRSSNRPSRWRLCAAVPAHSCHAACHTYEDAAEESPTGGTSIGSTSSKRPATAYLRGARCGSGRLRGCRTHGLFVEVSFSAKEQAKGVRLVAPDFPYQTIET